MQNRLVGIKDADYELSYAYDNNGNRTRIDTSYGDGQLYRRYNTYDSMNRQLKVNWEWFGDDGLSFPAST